MSISTRYVLIASVDVTPEAEPLFNEVYDTEHVPNLLQVPGVHSVTRMKGEPARFAIACCAAGGIIRSSVATRYQLVLFFQAGSVTLPSSAATPHGTSSRPIDGETRSWLSAEPATTAALGCGGAVATVTGATKR